MNRDGYKDPTAETAIRNISNMRIQKTYAFLDGVRKIDADIVKKQLMHDELESCLLPKAITYDKDRVQTSPEDAMSQIAANVLDLEKQIRQLKIRKAKLIDDIISACSRLDNDTEEIILLAFYVRRMPASRIAETVHYSISGVFKIKHRAVVHLSEKMYTK